MECVMLKLSVKKKKTKAKNVVPYLQWGHLQCELL